MHADWQAQKTIFYLFYGRIQQRRTIKMHLYNCSRIFHLMCTLLHVLLIFSHFIPVAYGESVAATASPIRSTDDASVPRKQHRDQFNINIITFNHKLELNVNLNSSSTTRSDNKNSASNYINNDANEKRQERINPKKVVWQEDENKHNPLSTKSKQAMLLAPFISPSDTTWTMYDIFANKSFLPSKLSPQTATPTNLSIVSPYTSASISGLNVDGAIICDCTINVTPITNDKRRQEQSPNCIQQCRTRPKNLNQQNVEQYPVFRLPTLNSTTPFDVAPKQQRQSNTNPSAALQTFNGLSFKQLSIVQLFYYGNRNHEISTKIRLHMMPHTLETNSLLCM